MLTSPAEEKSGHPGGRLMIVADGMGGHRGGATASRLAGETVKTHYLESGIDDIPAALREGLTKANSLIFAESQTHLELRGMGTTTSALAVRGNEAWFAHVGDSRIYFIRGGEIQQLTDDHSLVASMVREGLLTAKEAETHPRRNVLQRSMGVSEEVEIDVRGPLEVQEGDTFVLCSDGLHGLVKTEEIKELVFEKQIEEAADKLVDLALTRGAPDNVTVIVARIERDDFDDEPTVVDKQQVTFESGAPAPPPASAAKDGGAPPSPPTAAEGGGAPASVKQVRGATIIKWMLLFVVILGAAGLWLFQTR